MMRTRNLALAPILFTALACSSNGGGKSQVNVAVKVGAASAFAADSCGNSLASAQLVLRTIKLEADGASEAEGAEVEAGPVLIDIAAADFNGTIQQAVISATVPNGTYTQASFDIHKMGGDSDDAAAATADPALAAMNGFSVRIAGTTTAGVAFTWQSDLDETQSQNVNVVVGDTTTGVDGITLAIDPSGWFHDASGACLDPNDVANQSAIEDNVKASIKMSEDDDHDGIDDANDPSVDDSPSN